MNNDIKIYIVGSRELFLEDDINILESYGNVLFLDNTSFSQHIINDNNQKIIVYDPDFGGWTFSKDILEKSSDIKAIFLGTTDKSYIDLDLCDKKNIQVFNIPKYSQDSVAEYLVMYMFALSKKIPLQIKNNNKQEFSEYYEQMQLKGKKVGIIGLGNIGSRIADMCNGIGMDVYYWDRLIKDTSYKYIGLEELFTSCDVIYLCLSINDETKKIVTDKLLNKINNNSIFISCTGKSLFNYSIVEEKIKNNELFGYALEEADISLENYDGNVMVTSEYAWFTKEARLERIRLWIKNVVDYFNK